MVNFNFMSGLIKLLVGSAIEASTESIKLKLAMGYLKLQHNSRELVIHIALLIFLIVILSLGFVLIPVSLCLYMPWARNVKAIVSISFALVYTIVPIIALMIIFSEKRWLSTTRMERFINPKK